MSTSSGSDASAGVDGDNSTVSSDTGSYPYYLIDLSRSMRVTKLAVLGGDNVALHPLENLEVRVGNITITTGGEDYLTLQATAASSYFLPSKYDFHFTRWDSDHKQHQMWSLLRTNSCV